jgi:hypothetical protein
MNYRRKNKHRCYRRFSKGSHGWVLKGYAGNRELRRMGERKFRRSFNGDFAVTAQDRKLSFYQRIY